MTTKAGQHHAKINHEKLRLVFTSDRELCDLVKTAFWFHLRLRRFNQVKTGSLESQAKCGNMQIVIGLSFHFCLQIWQSGFHLIVNDRVIRGVRRKLKCSDSSDSNFVALMTPIFYFHKHSYDSDSITSENQLLKAFLQVKLMNGKEITSTAELKKKTLFIAGKIYQRLPFQVGQ